MIGRGFTSCADYSASNVTTSTAPGPGYGASISSPATANTWGTGVSIGGSSTNESCFILLQITMATNTLGSSVQMMMKICSDSAGNDVLIPNIICTGASELYNGSILYLFPISVPPSASLYGFLRTDQSSSITITVRTTYLFARSLSPMSINPARYVDALGVDLSSSCGTTIVPGTSSDGAWTEIVGSTTRPYEYFQTGFGVVGSPNMLDGVYHVDIAYGNSSEKNIIYSGERYMVRSNKSSISKHPRDPIMFRKYVPTGSALYMRVQGSTSSEAGYKGAIYAMG